MGQRSWGGPKTRPRGARLNTSRPPAARPPTKSVFWNSSSATHLARLTPRARLLVVAKAHAQASRPAADGGTWRCPPPGLSQGRLVRIGTLRGDAPLAFANRRRGKGREAFTPTPACLFDPNPPFRPSPARLHNPPLCAAMPHGPSYCSQGAVHSPPPSSAITHPQACCLPRTRADIPATTRSAQAPTRVP